jgi:hypothetical protein
VPVGSSFGQIEPQKVAWWAGLLRTHWSRPQARPLGAPCGFTILFAMFEATHCAAS